MLASESKAKTEGCSFWIHDPYDTLSALMIKHGRGLTHLPDLLTFSVEVKGFFCLVEVCFFFSVNDFSALETEVVCS